MPLSIAPSGPRRSRGLPPASETELDRVLKLVPTETLAFYAAASPLLGVGWLYLALALFATGLVLAPLILFLDARSTGVAAPWQQYVARAAVFATWAMAIAWPFVPWMPTDTLRWLRSASVLLVPLAAASWLRDRARLDPER